MANSTQIFPNITADASGVNVLVGQSVTIQCVTAGVWNVTASTGNFFAA